MQDLPDMNLSHNALKDSNRIRPPLRQARQPYQSKCGGKCGGILAHFGESDLMETGEVIE